MTKLHTRPNWVLDTDNLWGAFKHVRDALANIFEIDDADPRVEWKCKQRPESLCGIEIEIRSLTA